MKIISINQVTGIDLIRTLADNKDDTTAIKPLKHNHVKSHQGISIFVWLCLICEILFVYLCICGTFN